MKICVSTSNNYLHIVPVFCYLFNKYWSPDQQVELVGYDRPKCKLPDNFSFYSHGQQGTVKEWSTNLRTYFEQLQEERIIYIMEDSLLRRQVDIKAVQIAWDLVGQKKIGRFDLTNDVQKRPHIIKDGLVCTEANSRYRLSTQPSIWSKKYLLHYLTPGLDPWSFETQDPKYDGWQIKGFEVPPLKCNEGVRRFDIHKLDLNGFPAEDVSHINQLMKDA